MRSEFNPCLTEPKNIASKPKNAPERAKLAPDPESKRTYESMQRQWLDLAKQAEKGGG